MSDEGRAEARSPAVYSRRLGWLHIWADVGVVLVIMFLPQEGWETLGAEHLRGHLMLLGICLGIVYGTAVMREERSKRLFWERVFALALILALGWEDGPQMALLRFAFVEFLALALSMGGCLVLYRFFFDVFPDEVLEKRGLSRYLAMLRDYVLPPLPHIFLFGVPLLIWSGFALEVYFNAYASSSVLSIAGAVLLLVPQVHARWVVMYRFLQANC